MSVSEGPGLYMDRRKTGDDTRQKRTAPEPGTLSRRAFLRSSGLSAAALALVQTPGFLGSDGWPKPGHAAASGQILDTLNSLVALIVPGPDAYSVHQGVSTSEPGGMDASISEVLIETLDRAAPFLPQFSATVAAILDFIAILVNPLATGPFPSPFARLSFPEKVRVLAIMESFGPLKPLAGVLPAAVAFLAYSEAGVYDSRTRTLTKRPVGWTISGYAGVSDGHDEFKGYFQDRRRVKG